MNPESLSGACQLFLGKQLLKSEQLSDWDARPLSREQLQYASLDAHATLALLDAMLLECGAQSGMNIVGNYYAAQGASARVKDVASGADESAFARKVENK